MTKSDLPTDSSSRGSTAPPVGALIRAWHAFIGDRTRCPKVAADGTRIPFSKRCSGYPDSGPEDVMTTLLPAGSLDEAPGTEFTAVCGQCGYRHRFAVIWTGLVWPPVWVKQVGPVDPAFAYAWDRNWVVPYRTAAAAWQAESKARALFGEEP